MPISNGCKSDRVLTSWDIVELFHNPQHLRTYKGNVYAFLVDLMNKTGNLKCSSTPRVLLYYLENASLSLISRTDPTALEGRSLVRQANLSLYPWGVESTRIISLTHRNITSTFNSSLAKASFLLLHFSSFSFFGMTSPAKKSLKHNLLCISVGWW